jgi:hypothetical protein
MSRNLGEQETIIRYDRADTALHLYTANPYDAAKWRKAGYPVEELSPESWRAVVPRAVLRPLRRLVDGQVVRRTGRQGFGRQGHAVQGQSEAETAS